MMEHTYLCHQCGNIFRVSTESTQLPEKELKCPQCGTSSVRELPSWMPLGSNLEDIPREWEYECQQCKHKFELPVPGNPSQERDIRCPDCTNRHIHRLTRTGFEPLYCG